MKLSIIGPAHRPQHWMELYNSLYTNVQFEIIFVTDILPDFELPREFVVIYSPVKPVQCIEIALRKATGDFIHWTADDTTYNPYAFDNALANFHKSSEMIIFRNIEDGEESTEFHRFYSPSAPRMMPYGIISHDLLDSLKVGEGYCDKQFIGGQWENDLIMRAYANGASSILCKNAIAYSDHIKKHDGVHSIRDEVWQHDTRILKSLWFDDGQITYKRTRPVDIFLSQGLETETQGPKGRW